MKEHDWTKDPAPEGGVKIGPGTYVAKESSSIHANRVSLTNKEVVRTPLWQEEGASPYWPNILLGYFVTMYLAYLAYCATIWPAVMGVILTTQAVLLHGRLHLKGKIFLAIGMFIASTAATHSLIVGLILGFSIYRTTR